MDFKIENSQIALFFPKIPAIRKTLFSLEESLGDQFVKPFTLLQIPDEAFEEIPRIQAKTKLNHTLMNIAQSNISLVTNFDNGWESDWSKCREYLTKNFKLIYSIADCIGAKTLSYSGFSINVFIPFKDEKDALNHMNRVFFPNKDLNKLHEFTMRFVHKLQDKFFINYTYTSVIKYKANNPFIITPAYLSASEYGINLNIDINDRYGAGYQKGYISDPDIGDQLLNSMNFIVTQKLDNLISQGEFEL